MADVFISYCSKDREVARSLANSLAARGHSVWWDRAIVTGESFDQVIERELESARAVDLDAQPKTLSLNPRNELSYRGVIRRQR